MTIQRSTVITASQDGRADAVLREHFPHASRSFWRDLFQRGGVKRRGQTLAKGAMVRAGEELELGEEPPRSSDDLAPLADSDVPLIEIASSRKFVAINKPPAVHSHPLMPNETGTIANAVRAHYPECALASDDPREGGLIHRLDHGTSGVLVFARSRPAWQEARGAMLAGLAHKTYLALTHGSAQDGFSSFKLETRGDHVVVSETGQPATSRWKVLAQSGDYALLRITANTGRRHQIRVHLASSGLPIVGDTLYGGNEAPASLVEFFLHAETFALPGFGPIVAPLPSDRIATLRALDLPIPQSTQSANPTAT